MPTYSLSPSRLGYTCDTVDEPVHDQITGDCYDNLCEAEAAGVRRWGYGCAPMIGGPAYYSWGPSGSWAGDGGWSDGGFPWRRHRRGGGSVPRAGGPRGGGGFRAAPRTQRAMTNRAPQPQITAVRRPATAMPMRSSGAQRAGGQSITRGMHGLGQVLDTVSPRWKYAALGLGALAVAQFFWWNAKAPNVLKLRVKRNGQRRRKAARNSAHVWNILVGDVSQMAIAADSADDALADFKRRTRGLRYAQPVTAVAMPPGARRGRVYRVGGFEHVQRPRARR